MAENVAVLYVQKSQDIATVVQAFLDTITPSSTPSVSVWNEGSQFIVTLVYTTA